MATKATEIPNWLITDLNNVQKNTKMQILAKYVYTYVYKIENFTIFPLSES